DARTSAAVHEEGSRAHPQPSIFRGGAPHAGRPRAGGNRPRPCGVSRPDGSRSRLADGTPRRAGGGRDPASRTRGCALGWRMFNDGDQLPTSNSQFPKTALRVLLVEALVLVALWLVGRWFSA